MDYQNIDKINVERWYKTAIVTGKTSAEKVGWSSTYNQQVRFKVLSGIGNLNNKSVLDFGCGLAEFYPYLKSIYPKIIYTGMDFIEEYIIKDRIRFPEVNFILGDSTNLTQNYDYILTSGVFSYKIEQSEKRYKQTIKHLCSYSRIAFGANFLLRGKHIDNSVYNTWDPQELLEWAKKISPKVEIINDYLAHDFTLFLYNNG